MKVYPQNNKVLIRRKENERKTASGLFIPETAETESSEGTVLAVGKGKVLPSGRLVEPLVKPGDKVIFESRAQEIELDGEKLLLIEGDYIHAVLEN